MRLANIWRCFMSYAFPLKTSSPVLKMQAYHLHHLWALRLLWNKSMCYWCRACANHRTTDIHICFNLHAGHLLEWTGKDWSLPPPWVSLLKGNYSILNFHQFMLKNFEHLLLGTGRSKIKDLVACATWPGFLTPPTLGAFRCDAPTLSRVCSSQ